MRFKVNNNVHVLLIEYVSMWILSEYIGESAVADLKWTRSFAYRKLWKSTIDS